MIFEEAGRYYPANKAYSGMKKIFLRGVLSFILPCIFFSASALAGPLADEKLLEYLKANGALTEAQVREIQCTLYQEQKKEASELSKKEAGEVKVKFEDGLRIEKGDKSFSLRIGGLLQSDMRMFDSHYPVNNDFDIRRARLGIEGRLYQHFFYKLEAELEGNTTDRLVDAYINYDYFPYLQLQTGQFKEPFSLEQLTSDKYFPFNERSFAYYLTPGRDVGFMVHGTLLDEAVQYAAGIFNGEGRDAARIGQKDDKEVTGRLVVRPFQHFGPGFLKGLQVGGSYSYARLATSDFNLKVKTPAQTDFFTVQARAKFNITQEVDSLDRHGFELAYTCGPVYVMGEYIQNKFHEVQLVKTKPFNFDLRSWYAGGLLMLTGEKPAMKAGVLQKIRPKKNFNIRQRTWGALGLGFRYQSFEAGRVVYQYLVEEGFSVRKADAFTLALNWYLNDMIMFTLDYSRTKFYSPLFLGTNQKGYSYYEETENLWHGRFQLEF